MGTWLCRINVKNAVTAALASKTPGFDLYMRDRYDDNGHDEGYAWTWDFDQSPDIWVRNDDDYVPNDKETQINEMIEFSGSQTRYVYVRIGNMGCSPTNGSESVTVYATHSSSGTSFPNDWTTFPHGQVIGTQNIPQLMPGESVVIKFPWSMMYNLNHCIMARIDGGTVDPIDPYLSLGEEIWRNNNVSLTNINVVDVFPGIAPPNPDLPHGSYVTFHSISNKTELHDFNFAVPSNSITSTLLDEAEITLSFDDAGWNLLYNDLANHPDITIVDQDLKRVQLKAPLVELKNISVPAGFDSKVWVGVNFLTEEVTSKPSFAYYIYQNLSQPHPQLGVNYTGSVKLIFNKEPREHFVANAGGDRTIQQGEGVFLEASLINETATYKWYDENGDLVYEGDNFNVTPTQDVTYTLEVTATSDSYKDYDEVHITVESCYLEVISPNPISSNGTLTVNYNVDNVSNAEIKLVNINTGVEVLSHPISINSTSDDIVLNNVSSGLYKLVLVCDGDVRDEKSLSVQ